MEEPYEIPCFSNVSIVITLIVGRVVTAYRLNGPGIKSRWRQDFPHLSRPALRPTQSPVQWVPGLSQGWGVAGAW